MATLAGYVLAYDADCSMCTRFRNTIEFLDAHRNLRFMSIDNAEQAGLLDALPDALRHRSFHLVLPDMRLQSGSEALPALIGLLPTGRVVSKMVTSTPIGGWILRFLYSTVASRHEAGLCKLRTVRGSSASELEEQSKENQIHQITKRPSTRISGLLTALFLV